MVRLLYQINEKARNVSFVIANSNADIINSIENGKTLTLSFEEIKKNIEDISLYFDRYDYSVSRIAKRLDRSKKPLIKEIDKLKKGTSNNSNILVHYYTHILSNQALTERKRIDDSVYDLISFNSIANNSKSKMIELMNNIKRTFFSIGVLIMRTPHTICNATKRQSTYKTPIAVAFIMLQTKRYLIFFAILNTQ